MVEYRQNVAGNDYVLIGAKELEYRIISAKVCLLKDDFD